MPRRAVIGTLVLGLMVVGVAILAVAEKESGIQKSEVPAAVNQAFSRAYPSAKMNAVDKEVIGGQTYYEIEAIEGSTERDYLYTANGSLFQVGEEIDVKEVPDAVRTAIKRAFPDSELEEADRITRGDETLYEVAIETGKAEHELLFTAAGIRVAQDSFEDADEDEDGDDDDDDEEDDD